MKYIKDVVLIIVLFSVLDNTHASEPFLDFNEAQHNIEQLQRGNKKKMVENEIKREKNIQQGDTIAEQSGASDKSKSAFLFQIDEIIVENDEKYDLSPERNAIIEQYLHTKMGEKEILTLVKALTNFYIAKGYVTTQVTILAGSLRTQKLVLKVLWGKLSGFLHNGEIPGWREKFRMFSAMPFSSGSLLNIRDIDQGLDNLLRVSVNDKLNIVPTDNSGFSVINHQSDWIFPLSLHVGMNNSGFRDFGWYQYYLSASLKNGLGINDIFSYYYSKNDLKAITDNQTSKSLYYDFPLGYWLFESSYYQSEYKKVIGGNVGNYVSEGKSTRMSMKISRTLARNADGKTSGYVKLEKRKNENAIFGFPIAVSSKDYTNITSGFNWVGGLLGGWGYADISMTAGTPWFDSVWKNDADLQGFDINYMKYNGMLIWNKSVLSSENNIFSVYYEVNSGFQYTNDRLVSDARYSLGDEYTIRGYKENGISADRALYLANTLKFPVNINYARLYQITPFTGIDIGMASRNCPVAVRSCKRDYMSGIATGIKISGKEINSSYTAAWPVKKPASLKGASTNHYSLYFSLDIGF